MKTKFIALCTVLMLLLKSNAQDTSTVSIWDMSLIDMMNMEVTVATKKSTNLRETPGIITVINKDEIQNSGARDLIDIFHLYVPGFDFGVDVEGVVGIGARGMWANDGKILLMIDGQELNEGMFGTTVYGNHIPVENIERIEIIRGPGSAIYGGFAGLAVINIITHDYNIDGGYASILYSTTEKSYSHRNVYYGFGKKNNDFKISFTGVCGQGTRSERDNADYLNNAAPMLHNSELNINNINLNMLYKGIDFRAIVDEYKTTQIDLWGENYFYPVQENFRTYMGQLKYDAQILPNVTITPKLFYKSQNPWEVVNYTDTMLAYSNMKRYEKLQGGVSGIWDFFKDGFLFINNGNIVAGLDYSRDLLHLPKLIGPYEETYNTNASSLKDSVDNYLQASNIASYLQLMLNTNIVNLTAGARYDKNSEFGDAFVPRVGVTKVIKDFHIKGMFSQSFRVPGGIMPNRVPAGKSLQPEMANSYELETGYKFPFNLWLIINGYSTEFSDVIIYKSDPTTGIGCYENSGKIGTLGAEAVIKYYSKKINAQINYAFYQRATSNFINFDVPVNKDVFLAFAPHKANGSVDYKLNDNFNFNVSASIWGERYGYSHKDTNGIEILKRFGLMPLVNCNIIVRNLPVQNLEFHVGCHNIMYSDFAIIQPYYGAHAPLPAMDRAYMIKLKYKF